MFFIVNNIIFEYDVRANNITLLNYYLGNVHDEKQFQYI